MDKLIIRELVDTFGLEVVAGENGLDHRLEESQLSRPGIELAGLFDFYESNRIQLFGSKEVTFFGWLRKEEQDARTRILFEHEPPAFVFSKNADIPQVFIDEGNARNIPVLKSRDRTSSLASHLYQYLFTRLAPRKTLHGTLMDINGVGVMLRGKSGIGKSEIALELVRRGHQLVADDRVDIFEREPGTLIGEAPKVLREHLEIRGIGIVNVVKLFGASAFKEDKTLMLIIDLEPWGNAVDYDRLGIEDHTETLFDTEVRVTKIPVTAARNVSTLVEVAAMNARLRFLGTHMGRDFTEALNKLIKENASKKE